MRIKNIICYISAPLVALISVCIYYVVVLKNQRDYIDCNDTYSFLLKIRILAGLIYLIALLIPVFIGILKRKNHKMEIVMGIELIQLFIGIFYGIILLIGINGSVNDLKGTTEKAIYKNKYGTVEKFLDKNDNYIMLWNDGRRCLNDDGTIYELLIKLEYEEINEKQYISSSNRMEYYVKLDEFAYLEINDLGYAKIYVDSAKYYWGYYYYFKTDAASASYIYELASGKSEPYLLG